MFPRAKTVDGQNIVYHYIQKCVLSEDVEFSKELLKHLLIDLSIWLPGSFYRRLPIILPYVVRDNSCRIKTDSGHDEWGSANSNGFLRDDNSLLKGIVRTFTIKSPKIPAYNSRRLGTGFVASHIWGRVEVDGSQMISSRHYLLNSFVPNLVWLPVQISKLTDREDSFAKKLLQVISQKIYRGISLPQELSSTWDFLNHPKDPSGFSVDVSRLNYFEVTDEWLTKRIRRLNQEIDDIVSIDTYSGHEIRKVKSSRYIPTLKQIPFRQRQELNRWLSRYKALLRS